MRFLLVGLHEIYCVCCERNNCFKTEAFLLIFKYDIHLKLENKMFMLRDTSSKIVIILSVIVESQEYALLTGNNWENKKLD